MSPRKSNRSRKPTQLYTAETSSNLTQEASSTTKATRKRKAADTGSKTSSNSTSSNKKRNTSGRGRGRGRGKGKGRGRKEEESEDNYLNNFDFSSEKLFSDSFSPLVYIDLASLFTNDIWDNVFTEEERDLLLELLPESDKVKVDTPTNGTVEILDDDTTLTSLENQSAFDTTDNNVDTDDCNKQSLGNDSNVNHELLPVTADTIVRSQIPPSNDTTEDTEIQSQNPIELDESATAISSADTRIQSTTASVKSKYTICPNFFKYNYYFREFPPVFQNYISSNSVPSLLSFFESNAPKIPSIVETNKFLTSSDETEDDGWKDENFESYWGELMERDLQKMRVAGESAAVPLTELVKTMAIRKGDILNYKKLFLKSGITVDISVKVTDTTKDGKLSIATLTTPIKTFTNITTPTQLETKILDHDARISKKNRPNGNAFKSFSLSRGNVEKGKLFDLRMDYWRSKTGGL
ncbi:hypothetical protein BKA69DRAFT_1088994 [Paraphysoderma sedebokerense]|nr:hypothetical protein BKA69DRAFT_1088994 [Paraphysoderma sedebokerense]